MYKCSIIIPHFNSSETLETLLKTIPDNKEIEVIIVDDKSTHEHIEVIQNMRISKEYREFTFLTNETKIKSAGTCRNIGIEYATGKWIFFADADDYFHDNFYERIGKYLDSENDVIFFSPTSIYLDTKEEANRHIQYQNIILNYLNNRSIKNSLYLKYHMYPPWLKLIKAELIHNNQIKFDEIIASNDVLFSTKVGFYMQKFIVSGENIYMVTRNKGSLSVNYSKKVIENRLNTHISWYKFLKDKLSKNDLCSMKINSLSMLSIASQHSVSMFLKAFYSLVKNRVPIVSTESIRLSYLVPRLYNRFIKSDVNKKYRIKLK